MESSAHDKFNHMRDVVDDPELAVEDEIRVIQDELLTREGRTISREEAIALIKKREKGRGKVSEIIPDASEPPLDYLRDWERKKEDANDRLCGLNGLGLKGDASNGGTEPTLPSKP